MADVVRIVRPYRTEAELIEAEGWTVTKKGMLLVGEGPRDPGTVVRFEVSLESGERLVRAEAKVLEHSAAEHV